MKSVKFATALAALLLAAMLSLSLLNTSTASGLPTDPITITGDADLAVKAAQNGWPGDGTASSPYVISSLRIDDPVNGLGIFVSGTTKHLVIEDSFVGNTSSFAIDITGASNVTIRDSTLNGDFCAIMLYSSHHCTIQGNAIASSRTGIQLMNSDHITISGNTIAGSTYNGIELATSSNCTIASNTVSGSGGYGIYLSSSNGNVIYGNTFSGNNGAGASYRVDHAQAYDLGSNQWSFGSVDNEWSDWSSEEAYPYEGSAAAEDIGNAFPVDELLPILGLVAAIAVVAVIAAVVLKNRKSKDLRAQQAQGPVAQPYAPPVPASSVEGPARTMGKPKVKAWVPAAVVGVVAIVAVLVMASTMGWLPVGSGKISGARGIGGTWEGTATFWSYNIYGEKAMLIEADLEMRIILDGNHVTGVLDIYPTSQTPLAEMAVSEPENHIPIDGTYEITTLTFKGYKTQFEFEFLTDMATGKATNLDTSAYLGLGSDPGAFHLQRG